MARSPLEGFMTESKFRESKGISFRQWTWFKRQGLAPDFVRIGARHYVTPEAARRWESDFEAKARAATERAAAAEAEAAERAAAATAHSAAPDQKAA